MTKSAAAEKHGAGPEFSETEVPGGSRVVMTDNGKELVSANLLPSEYGGYVGLMDLYTEPGYRGRGHARELLRGIREKYETEDRPIVLRLGPHERDNGDVVEIEDKSERRRRLKQLAGLYRDAGFKKPWFDYPDILGQPEGKKPDTRYPLMWTGKPKPKALDLSEIVKDLTKSALVKVVDTPDGTEYRRRRTYVGDDSRLSEQQINKLVGEMERRGGVDLDKMPVLASEQQFLRNMGRYFVPKTIRQVPSRVVRNLWPATTVLSHGYLGLPDVLGAIEATRLPPDDMYVPAFGTVNVGYGRKGSLAHETGHWVDLERNLSDIPRRGILRRRPGSVTGGHRQLDRELAATLFALKAAPPGDKARIRKGLRDALTSYVASVTDSPGDWGGIRSLKPVKPDRNWKKKYLAALDSGDRNAARDALRSAVAYAYDYAHKAPGDGSWGVHSEHTGDVRLLPAGRVAGEVSDFLIDQARDRAKAAETEEQDMNEDTVKRAYFEGVVSGLEKRAKTGKVVAKVVQMLRAAKSGVRGAAGAGARGLGSGARAGGRGGLWLGKKGLGGTKAVGRYALSHPGAAVGVGGIAAGTYGLRGLGNRISDSVPGSDGIIDVVKGTVTGAKTNMSEEYSRMSAGSGNPVSAFLSLLRGGADKDRTDVMAARFFAGSAGALAVYPFVSDYLGIRKMRRLGDKTTPVSRSLALLSMRRDKERDNGPDDGEKSDSVKSAQRVVSPYQEIRDITTQDPDEYLELQRRRRMGRNVDAATVGGIAGAVLGMLVGLPSRRGISGAAIGAAAGIPIGAGMRWADDELTNYMGYPLHYAKMS